MRMIFRPFLLHSDGLNALPLTSRAHRAMVVTGNRFGLRNGSPKDSRNTAWMILFANWLACFRFLANLFATSRIIVIFFWISRGGRRTWITNRKFGVIFGRLGAVAL